MKKYTVIKDLNWMNDRDVLIYNRLEDALAFAEANKEYILEDFAEGTGAKYDYEIYYYDVKYGNGISKYRAAYVDTENRNVDWRIEIIENVVL